MPIETVLLALFYSGVILATYRIYNFGQPARNQIDRVNEQG